MSSITGQDFNTILRFPFKDPKWFSKLCLQGAVLTLVASFIIGVPFVLGWQLVLMRNGINENDDLPGWDQWGEYWSLGIKAIVAALVYSAPIWITALLLMVPAIIITVILGESRAEEFAIAGLIPLFLGAIVIMLWSLLLYFMQPAYMTALAAGASLKEVFQLKKFVFPYIKANFVSILLAWAIAYVAGLIASLGMFLFFIGYFFTYPYAIAVMSYTYGLIYRKSTVKVQRKKGLEGVAKHMGVPIS